MKYPPLGWMVSTIVGVTGWAQAQPQAPATYPAKPMVLVEVPVQPPPKRAAPKPVETPSTSYSSSGQVPVAEQGTSYSSTGAIKTKRATEPR